MNLYHTDKYQAYRSGQETVFQESSLTSPKGLGPVTQIGPDILVSSKFYEGKRNGFPIYGSEHTLTDARGRNLYAWRNVDNEAEYIYPFTHKNGKKYVLFREDLYGYSILELDTMTDFHYIPSCSFSEKKEEFKETFLWTQPFYDPQSGFLAVSGCEWGCPWSVIVLDFSEPLKEHGWEQWINLHQVIDPGYHVYDDLDVSKWDENGNLEVTGCRSDTEEKEALLFTRERLTELLKLN